VARKTPTGRRLRQTVRGAVGRRSGTTATWLVLPVSAAMAYEPSGREVCISITNPRSAPVPVSEKFADVLRIAFSDIAAPSAFPFDELFEVAHARAIIEFVNRWTDVDRIVVHCVGGVSRSPAVALAVAELRGEPTDALEQRFPLWNTWVRHTLVKVGRVQAQSTRPRARSPRVRRRR
jgi:hypothetical protein